MKLDRGYLVAFEGIDGTGKSTQCSMLAEALTARGLPVRKLAEPTHGVWGKKIRNILSEGRGNVTPEEELSWFINDRKEDVEKNIRPALDNNEIVLIDRYYYSTAAYQGALGLDPEEICRENEAFAPPPDLVFLFLVSPEQCLERIEKSREGVSSFERIEYLEKVRAIFESFDGPAIRKIDGLQSIETIQVRLIQEINSLLSI